MEGLSQQELRTSIKVEYRMHKDKGKSYIIRHFWPFIRNKMITEVKRAANPPNSKMYPRV